MFLPDSTRSSESLSILRQGGVEAVVQHEGIGDRCDARRQFGEHSAAPVQDQVCQVTVFGRSQVDLTSKKSNQIWDFLGRIYNLKLIIGQNLSSKSNLNCKTELKLKI